MNQMMSLSAANHYIHMRTIIFHCFSSSCFFPYPWKHNFYIYISRLCTEVGYPRV